MTEASDKQRASLAHAREALNASLSEATAALETYASESSKDGAGVKNTGDIKLLESCRAHLRQAHGSLCLVQLRGAALLTGEMCNLLDTLLAAATAGAKPRFDQAAMFASMIQAMSQLTEYFAYISSGHADVVVIFLPQVNTLRRCRGREPLQPESFFNPIFSGIQPQAMPTAGTDIAALIKQTRHNIHLSMLQFFKNQHAEKPLQSIIDLFEQYYRAANSEFAKQVYWLGAAVTEALMDNGLDRNNSSIKQIFGHIDHQSKLIVADGEQALIAEPPNELVRMLLYYIASATSQGQRVMEIRKRFHLADYLPQADELQSLRKHLSGPGPDIMQAVVANLQEELETVHDMLDMYSRSGGRDHDKLLTITRTLKKHSGGCGNGGAC